jgi:hypothetical protein
MASVEESLFAERQKRISMLMNELRGLGSAVVETRVVLMSF